MTLRLLTLCVAVVTAAACNVTQPLPGCVVGHGAFAAKYFPVSGTGTCAEKKGATLSVSKYIQATGATQADGFDPPADFSSGVIYIAASGTDVPADLTPAVGDLASGEPENDVCAVTSPSVSESTSTTSSYAWSNVQIFVTPGIFGTQIGASLTITEPGCSATYNVAAMFPSVSCASDADATQPDVEKCKDPKTLIDPSFDVTCDPDLLTCVLTKMPLAVK